MYTYIKGMEKLILEPRITYIKRSFHEIYEQKNRSAFSKMNSQIQVTNTYLSGVSGYKQRLSVARR